MNTLIFDFDGTIVDNLDQVMVLLQKSLLSRGVDLSQYPVPTLRNIGVRNFMKQIKVSKLTLLSIYREIKKEIHSHLNDSPPVENLVKVLEKLTPNHNLYIFSSNNQATINSYLTKYHLGRYFTGVYEDDSYFGKEVGLKKLIEKNKLSTATTYYLGDESRDIVAAKKVGIGTIGVLWGFEGEIPMSSANPDYLVSTPQELLKLVNQL